MLDINDLMDVIVQTWQTVPELLAAVDSEVDAIYAFKPGRPEYPSYTDALSKLATPGILLSHTLTTLGLRGGMTQWRHTFRADFKVPAELGSGALSYVHVMKYLIDGVPTSYGTLTLMQCQFDDRVDSMEDVAFTTQTDSDGNIFYRMEFSLQERTENI